MPIRLAAPLAALLLGACVEAVAEHPQVTHCKTALGWLVDTADVVQILDNTREPAQREAVVTLDLQVNGQPVEMTCEYDRGTGPTGRTRRARRITFGGEPLTDAQLEQVNEAVRTNRDPLRNLRRAI